MASYIASFFDERLDPAVLRPATQPCRRPETAILDNMLHRHAFLIGYRAMHNCSHRELRKLGVTMEKFTGTG